MKKILSFALCILFLIPCVLPVQASDGVPREVMEATKSVVRILSQYYNGSATGSGFVIKNEPGEVLIATNDHVVSGNPYSISVWVGENELVDAEIVFTTSAKDLCVLRVTDPIDMKPLTLSTEDPQHGAAIYVVGYPGAGDILSDTQAHTSESVTITDGIISAIRTFTIENNAEPVKLLQVNAAINSGNSGGPLFNSEGVVIGVNTYKVNANSQGVFGSVDISELWDLLNKHGIVISQEQPEAQTDSEKKEFPVAVAVGIAAAILVLAVLVVLKNRKKQKAVSLRSYVARFSQGMGISEAVSMLLPVAIQLRDLHTSGKLHLQVSPDSIWISSKGAVLKEPTKKEPDRHCSGFAAPEIYKGAGYGVASDIYSFAAVLMFAALGRVPANSLQQDILAIELIQLEENENIFGGVIRNAMAFLPQDRTQSMQELIYGISAFNEQKFHLAKSTEEAIPRQKKKKVKKQKTATKGVPVATALALVVIAVILLWEPYVQPEIDARKETVRLESAYNAAVSLMDEGNYEEAMEAFAALAGYKDSQEQIDNCRIAIENATLEEKYQEAEALAAEGKHAYAGIAFAKLDGYKDSRERSFEQWGYTRRRTTIAFQSSYPAEDFWIGLKNDGTVISTGSNKFGQRDVDDWTDIIEVGTLFFASVGLKEDGTVVVAGEYDNQYYNYMDMVEEIRQWTDIVSILTNSEEIYGLRNDGTVVAAGKTFYDRSVLEEWTDVVSFCQGQHLLGLRIDGTVVGASNDYFEYGQCRVDDWKDVIKLDSSSFNGYHTMGLQEDGTVYFAGAILADGWVWNPYHGKIEGWTDIIDICGPIGLHADGTVSVFPEDAVYHKTNNTSALWKDAVKDWEGIVALRGGGSTIYGLKEDGTVIAAGSNWNGTTNVSDWTDIKDIVQANLTIGIKSDGSLVVAEHVNCEIEKWTDIRLP